MTSLRFIGDLSLWQGLLLALAVGAFSWWLYRREVKELSGPAGWLLPTLRSAAIVLALLVLTAPVLHHRYREGQPGRLRFLIDGSRSMSITDRHFDAASKLAIAQSLGWIDRQVGAAPSTSSIDSADKGAAAAQSTSASAAANSNANTTAAEQAPESSALATQALERFDNARRYERALDRLLTADGGVLTQVRDDFEIVVERFDRQKTALWESTLTKSAPLPSSAQAWLPTQYGDATQLGMVLAAGINASKSTANATDTTADSSTSAASKDAPAAAAGEDLAADETLVLLSDGRNTSGISPLAIAEGLAARHRPVFVIGYGGTQSPEDISLIAIEHPERVFERDMLRGTLVVRERMHQAVPLKVSIQLAGEVVWEETRTLSESDRGRIDFAFAVKPLVEKFQQSTSRTIDFSSVPLHLEAAIEPQTGEADATNNRRMFHVSVVTKRSKLLLVDGRSRWETRYLHNMFERDPAWQVDLVLPDYRETPGKLPQGETANQWPATKEKLLEYDLVILGEVPATALPPDSAAWLKSFVESSGGGLIVVDGQRGALRDPAFKHLHEMLPVEWIRDNRVKPDPVQVQLTSTAKQLSVFQLTPSEPAKNEAAWSELPPLHMTTAVKSLPGSEVLATTSQENLDLPLMVTRQFGAGRVFYCGTDETWRWRYKVADTYHQRFWNQVARWVMRLPMSVQGQYVSIDSGKLVYQPGESIVIRSRLRNAQGEPASGLAVEAVVTAAPLPGSEQAVAVEGQAATDESRVIAVVPLSADSAIAGVYSGQIHAPTSGNYQVSIVAPGLTSTALAIHSEFSVVEPDSGEMDQLSCDEPLLRKLAETTGGKYLSEQQGDQLVDLLKPLSQGKIVESDTQIWQSYWWFVPIVLLLSIEWWLRKRVGLL